MKAPYDQPAKVAFKTQVKVGALPFFENMFLHLLALREAIQKEIKRIFKISCVSILTWHLKETLKIIFTR